MTGGGCYLVTGMSLLSVLAMGVCRIFFRHEVSFTLSLGARKSTPLSVTLWQHEIFIQLRSKVRKTLAAKTDVKPLA